MTNSRTALRRVALGGMVLALGLPAPATAAGSRAHAAAGPTATSGAPVRSGSPHSAVDRVADFYGSYLDVLHDSGRGQLADALRRHYLTAGLRERLARWEARHHQDGMLRAEGVPVEWSVVVNDSGMGHCWSRVTLTWKAAGHPHTTRLMVQSDLSTLLISGIRTDE
ncbi:hypothetical protein ACWDCC_07580 [Streptomyces sp. NPDC001102]